MDCGLQGTTRRTYFFARQSTIHDPQSTIYRGFTLIELILVVVILGVALAFLIPSMFHKRILQNETAAVASLRNIVTCEAVWRSNDMDGNQLPDFWTADVFGFYALADGAGNPSRTIEIEMARSDRDHAGAIAGYTRPRPYYAVPFPGPPLARMGYFMEALVNDNTGAPYAQDGPDSDTKALEVQQQFGFAAIPETYGWSGINVYIVDEEGVIYCMDSGRVPAVNTLNWPRADPTKLDPPEGPWRVKE